MRDVEAGPGRLFDYRRIAVDRLFGRVVIVVHVPKTGGSSLWRSLVGAAELQASRVAIEDLHARSRQAQNWEGLEPRDFRELCLRTAAEIREEWLTTAHRELWLHHHDPVSLQTVFPEARYVVMYRDPTIRMASHFRDRDLRNGEDPGNSQRDSFERFHLSHPGMLSYQSWWLRRVVLGEDVRRAGVDDQLSARSRMWAVELGDYARWGQETQALGYGLGLGETPLQPEVYAETVTDRASWEPSDVDRGCLQELALTEECLAEVRFLSSLNGVGPRWRFPSGAFRPESPASTVEYE